MISIIEDVYCCIIAGGEGSRLFPYSSPKWPKQFCLLNERNTFIQQTIENLTAVGLDPTKIIVLVTSEQQAELAKRQVTARGVLSQNVFIIPATYQYAGAMCAGSNIINEKFGDSIVLSTPADQFVVPGEDFKNTIETAIAEAENHNVIIGVKINDLTMAMGLGHAVYTKDDSKCYKVESFVEKPNAEIADKIMRSGKSAGNTGICVWKSGMIRDLVTEEEIEAGLRTDELMKKIDPYIVVGKFVWQDCGTLQALYEISDKTPHHQNASLGEVDRFECKGGLFIADKGYRLHVAGVINDAVVVSTIDDAPAVAVVKRSESQRVREIASAYRKDRKSLSGDFSFRAYNNVSVRSNLSKKAIVAFVGVENYAVLIYRGKDGMVDVFVSKQKTLG